MSVLRLAVQRLALAALILLAAQSALATDYFADGAGGAWNANTTWDVGAPGGATPPAGVFPGSAVGDRAFLVVPTTAVTVGTSIPNEVELNINCSGCFVSVNAGGMLKIGGASAVVSGGMALNAGGTLTGAGMTTFNSGTQFGVSGGKLDGHTIHLNGGLTQTGAWSIDNSGQIIVGPTGLYDIQTLGAVTSNTVATAKITNNGTFRKSSGAGGTNVDVPVDNNNLVDVQIGTVVLGGTAAVSTNGTFNIVTGAGIEFHSTFAGTCTIQGLGTAKFVGTANIVDTGVVNVSAPLKMAGGVILGPAAGAATMNVSSFVTFDGGGWQQNLTVNMGSGSTLDFTGVGTAFIHNAHVDNAAGALIQLTPGGGLQLNSTGWISNSGTFRLLGDAIISTDGVGSSRIDNDNIFEKTAGAGIAGIDVTLNNNGPGSVSSTSGNIAFTRSSSHVGDFNICGGCFFDFSNGTHIFTGSTFNGSSGFTKVSNAAIFFVNFGGGATVNTRLVQTGGTITGNGILSVNNIFTWMGGTQDGSGSGETILGAFSHDFNGSTGPMTLARKMANNGTITYSGATHVLSIDTGGWLLNNFTFNIFGDYDIPGSGTGLFGNASGASLIKTAGTGYARLSCKFDNAGTLVVGPGQMALNGGGTNTSVIRIPSSTSVLAFEAGNYNFAAGTFIPPPDLGFVRVDGGGALTIGAPMSLDNVELRAGTITGSDLSIAEKLIWTGGTFLGPGNTNILGTATVDHLAPTALTTLDGRTMNNSGTFNYDPGVSQNLVLTNGAVFNNDSLFNILGDRFLAAGGGVSLFNNNASGTVRKTGGTSGTRFDMPLHNLGTVSSQVAGGTIIVNGGGSMNGGTMTTTDAGAQIDFFGGTFTVGGGTFTGVGKTRIVGGALQVNANVDADTILEVNSGILEVTSPNTFEITYLAWNGGTLQGAGTKRAGDGFISWVAPTLLDGSGILTLAGSFIYSADNVNFLTINSTADLRIESGATMTITGNGRIGGAATALVTSTGGTLAKSGSSTARIDVPVDFTTGSGGTIDVTGGGNLELAGGGTIEGSIQIAGLAGLWFMGGTFNIDPAATLSGAGSVFIGGATVNFNTPVTLASFFLNSGALGGTANVTVQAGGWSGGTMSGTGSLIVDNPATFTFGGIFPMSCTRPITNNGTAHFASSQTITTTAPFDNNGSVTFSSGPGLLALDGGGTHTGDFTLPFVSLRFGGTSHTFSATSSITGGGFVIFAATNSTLSGTYSLSPPGQTMLNPGSTTSFDTVTPAQTASISISGNLGGTAAVQVTGSGGSWQSGTVSGTAPFTIVDNTAFFAANGLTGPMILSRPLVNNGQFHYTSTANPLALDSGSIDNNGTFLYSGSTNVGIGAGGGTFNNDGTFLRNFAGVVNFDPVFTNNNLVRFLAGTVSFNGGYTQTTGTTELNGGNVTSPLAIDINGGSVIGNGTITGNLTSDGIVAPGLSPGAITITGNYTQSPAGTLNLEIGGTAPISGYDQLSVGGTVNLDGTVNIALINGFTPANGNIFDLVTFSARNGDFATKNIPTYPGGEFDDSYTATSFRLVADVIPVANDLSIVKAGPPNAQPGDTITFTITVSNSGPGSSDNVVVSDPGHPSLTFVANSGNCATPFPCSLGTIAGGASKTITAVYIVDSEADGSTIVNTATVSSTPPDANGGNNSASASVLIGCANGAPSNLAPTGTTVLTSGTLSWSPTGGETYTVYLGPAGSGCTTLLGTTSGTSMAYSGLAEDATYEWRVESSVPGCPTLTSGCVSFTTPKHPDECIPPPAPLASVIGQATSGRTYAVQWDAVPNAIRYEIDEADNAGFVNATTTSTTGLEVPYRHDTDRNVAWYYRVRAFFACIPGPYSPVIRIIIVPRPPADRPNPSTTVPVGTEELVVQEIFFPGQPGQTLFYSAVTDRDWLEVRPPSGVLPPEGVTLEVIGRVRDLPNGTFTASIIVTVNSTGASGAAGQNGPTTTTTPFSINLVTPVTPVTSKPATSQYTLIIPSVGHLDGINSHWQSDVRITNAGFRSTRYRLTFTPSGGTATGVKQTNITVDAGATTALDDVIKNWFGTGSLGDGSNGMLEILPLDDPANTSLATVASSRTYNLTATSGTLGQFIPAVPFASFIGRAAAGVSPPTLSLQQIAQSGVFRTNVGLAEAAGKAANATISIFNGAGLRLLDLPQSLAAGQQIQLNALLAQHGIELTDGRIEVKVGNGDGKITAYASVIDGSTGDPLLVSGALLGTSASTKYVLPGVANLNNPIAHWRTDVRIFNYGTIDQPALLTFHPFASAPSTTVEVLLAAGKVVALDNILASRFGLENTGGVVHLSTEQPSNLVVTARTYNQTDNGTFGQFIPAVTPNEATGLGNRTLNILQVEDSTRYRTNVGLAEVTGKPVTVELQVYLPDSKITPTVQVPLAANEFRQFALIRELGIGNVYNARVTVRVIGGEGRVTAYGSVIDEITQDPTYVPAQ